MNNEKLAKEIIEGLDDIYINYYQANYCQYFAPPREELEAFVLSKLPPAKEAQANEGWKVEEDRPGTASDFIIRAIAMLKDQYKDEWLVAGYNGIVALLGYAKSKIDRMDANLATLTAENERLREEVEASRANLEAAVIHHEKTGAALLARIKELEEGIRNIQKFCQAQVEESLTSNMEFGILLSKIALLTKE